MDDLKTLPQLLVSSEVKDANNIMHTRYVLDRGGSFSSRSSSPRIISQNERRSDKDRIPSVLVISRECFKAAINSDDNQSEDEEDDNQPPPNDDDTSSISFGSNEESKHLLDDNSQIILAEYDEIESLKGQNPLVQSQLEEGVRDQPDTDFTSWDFQPEEQNAPSQFMFCTYIESLKNTLNLLMKKRMKDPILQNTRKLILTATKGEHYSIDDEFKSKYCVGFDGEDCSEQEADVESALNREMRLLTSSQYVTRYPQQRYVEGYMERFQDSKVHKKLSKIYFPVDKSQLQKQPGFIPKLLMFSVAPQSKKLDASPEEIRIPLIKLLKQRKSAQKKIKPKVKVDSITVPTLTGGQSSLQSSPPVVVDKKLNFMPTYTKPTKETPPYLTNPSQLQAKIAPSQNTVTQKFRTSLIQNTPDEKQAQHLQYNQTKSFIQSPYRDPIERLFKKKETKKQQSDPLRQFPMVKFDDKLPEKVEDIQLAQLSTSYPKASALPMRQFTKFISQHSDFMYPSLGGVGSASTDAANEALRGKIKLLHDYQKIKFDQTSSRDTNCSSSLALGPPLATSYSRAPRLIRGRTPATVSAKERTFLNTTTQIFTSSSNSRVCQQVQGQPALQPSAALGGSVVGVLPGEGSLLLPQHLQGSKLMGTLLRQSHMQRQHR
ncbi:hypothetical protein FGO68_gene12530 [Halteria grandinella]|uniref:Uncharacterized protein n=1 Tax=Halteria grandinella TaxID=5974 RepID=A0A8J8NVL5_HALGN|nr:hypothetical protein FGO68_gene12530 [Halteria grandinella]